MVKTVGISGSISTSYTYSDELDDPTSELFERYAASVESEMTSIMMQSASVDSISTRVTSFEAAETGRRKRQAKVEFRGLFLQWTNLKIVTAVIFAQTALSKCVGLSGLKKSSFNQDKPKLTPQPLQTSRRLRKYQMIHQPVISKPFLEMKSKKLSMAVTKCWWVPTHLSLPVSFFSQKKIKRIVNNVTLTHIRQFLGPSPSVFSGQNPRIIAGDVTVWTYSE